MKFNSVNKKRIAFGIVDISNICQTGWALEIMKNLSDQMIFKMSDLDYDIFIDSNEDNLIHEIASDNFYTHAVIIAAGTSFRLNDKIFSYIEKLCETEFGIAGHILDRKDSYYELHHQFYILNLDVWKSLGITTIGHEEDIRHTQIIPIRSEENVHDDYVPLWIKQGSESHEYSKRKHGWNAISKTLLNNKVIIDVGSDIRSSKHYLYYEHDHVFIKELSTLHYYSFFGSNFVPATNSDRQLNSIKFNGPVEQYVTVGTGFNWIKNLELLDCEENTTVVFTDINPICLSLMRTMVTTWSGNAYETLYKSHTVIPNGDITIPESYYQEAQKSWERFKKQFSNWNSVWLKIKKLNFKFILINFTANYNLDWLEQNKKTVINCSDLFTYTPLVFNTSLKYRIACENKLIENIKNKTPDAVLMFSSRASDGFNNSKNLYFGKATDFELTDINTLKTPQWHSSDWQSYRILR